MKLYTVVLELFCAHTDGWTDWENLTGDWQCLRWSKQQTDKLQTNNQCTDYKQYDLWQKLIIEFNN
jgi:hypothetical protein